MNTYSETSDRRLYRDADRAMLGGVCAGLAEYFGLNLKVTRILAFIAFLVAMPVSIFLYLAAVCLIPAASYRGREVIVESRCCWSRTRSKRRSRRSRRRREAERRAAREERQSPPKPTLNDVRKRYQSLDKRLADLEKQVTSPRYQLEQEFRKL